ncbi:MAG: DUF6036 family nucleotidyltransferase [Gemmataceae bacterium]
MSGLWGLVWGKPEVDPARLASALERQAAEPGLDYRTRLLIRDSAVALEAYWGPARWGEWLARSPARGRIEAIRGEEFERVGFPALRRSIMDQADPEAVRQFLREVGTRLRSTVEVTIGGSIALLLTGRLLRATDDIDLVDEVPETIRAEHRLLDELAVRYGLRLTHFQSHFLPSGWQERRHGLEPFGNLRAYLVDELDVVLSKLFSKRDKDLDDIRLLLPGIDRARLLGRLATNCQRLLAEPDLRANAGRNWYILTGEKLP